MSLWKKVYGYKNFCVYFTYLPRSPSWADLHEILHEGSCSRRNQQCQILSQSDQRFWFCGGSNFWLSHMKKKSPLTHGLNYRSAYMLHTRCTNVVQVVEALMVSCTCQTAAVCNITQLSVKITSLPSDMDNVHSWYFIRRTFMFFYSVLVRNIALRSHP